MAGLMQPQPTQCLSLPDSICSPVDRCGLKRLAALVPENEGVDGGLLGIQERQTPKKLFLVIGVNRVDGLSFCHSASVFSRSQKDPLDFP
jgi:hypothetical protein